MDKLPSGIGETPNQFYARRPEDNPGVFAAEIAEVLNSGKSGVYCAKPESNLDSNWQVLAGGDKAIVLEVKLGYVSRGEVRDKVLPIPPEERKYSAINDVFKKTHGFDFYPDRIFEIVNKGESIDKEAITEAYINLSLPNREKIKPKTLNQISA